MSQKQKDENQKFKMTLEQLEAVFSEPVRTNRDRAGVIQCFEFTYETCWKFLRSRVVKEGVEEPNSPRESISKAFQIELIDDEKTWLQMIEDRNLTVHTYDEETAKAILERIQKEYLPLFRKLYGTKS